MKNFISILIVAFLFLGATLPNAFANSDLPIENITIEDEEQLEREIAETEKEIKKEIEEEISTLYGNETLEDIQSLGLGIEVLKNGQIIVDLELETTDFDADFELDMLPESDTIILDSSFVDETGNTHDTSLIAEIEENTNDIFKASLKNIETGEVYNIDTTELNASVLPIFVYVIGGVVIRTTAKHVGGIAIKKLSHKGFTSFTSLKRYLGSPGANRQWHHIVEQSQITRSGFSQSTIQNTRNIVAIDIKHHNRISAYYSSKKPISGNKTVRDWLSGKSFDYQYDFGMRIMKELE
ncbi:SAR2788 family putative toxin [Planococcus sp. S3-L1]|uniref:SAR2788 family putative toxin n=1 Tax=Planococcus sp. S3-L1 TaxID=3046200 RepID=UPI0024B8C327|nr:SAR2788 family putative toxin [Planococcus sp. S3-L1]MDJ0333446.1 SAR2788 family putative toxin [Planococcus sp. S3-L1]